MLGGIKSVWETLTNLPLKIKEALSVLFDNIKNAITALPNTILNGIKNIFIPDTQTIENQFFGFLDELNMKFNFDTDFFESLLTDGTPVTDINGEYEIPNVGSFNFKFLDTKFFIQGVEYFRPFIRGFIILLLGFYHIKMLLGFFRQDAGVITGKAVDMEMKARKDSK